jgi:hypothetical protein
MTEKLIEASLKLQLLPPLSTSFRSNIWRFSAITIINPFIGFHEGFFLTGDDLPPTLPY